MPKLRPRRGKTSLWSVLLTCFIVGVVSLLVLWIFGGVHGEEFSPQRFALRRFHYYQVPFLRLQIWPISFERLRGQDDALAKHIRSQQLMGDVGREEVRWDVMTMTEVGRAPKRGEATILTNYLRQAGAVGTDSWLVWSQKHPETARRLWPLVARLAHERIYELIPDVLESARRQSAPAQFEAAAQEKLAEELPKLADAERDMGNTARADQLSELATKIARAFPRAAKPSRDRGDAQPDPEAEVDPESLEEAP